MPKGPKGEKRPADVIGNAVKVMRIATGEIEEDTASGKPGKNAAAAELGRLGGNKRSQILSASRRKDIAAKAAATRWEKKKADVQE